MRERERVAVVEVRLDVLGVHASLLGVGEQHHDDVGFLDGIAGREHPQTCRLGLRPGARALAQPDADVDARVLQVQRMGVTLRSVPQDRDLATLEQRGVGIGVVVDRGGHSWTLLLVVGSETLLSRRVLGGCASPVLRYGS